MVMKVSPDTTYGILDRKVPILMYHEVSSREFDNKVPHHLTPIYDISAPVFERQIQTIAENRFHTITFGQSRNIDPGQNNIVISFDDGLVGNYLYAAPILKKYGFHAVFFVMVDAIGTKNYMSWDQLRELCASGMEVQSHTLSHRPLQTLSADEIYRELRGSKEKIEQELGAEVSALSFPHGSFNEVAVKIAAEVGYRTLCTSEVKCNSVQSFMATPAVLGRIAITSKFSLQQFQRCTECDAWEMWRRCALKGAKNFAKRIIGIENYRRLYRRYFNISAQQK